MCRHKKMNPSEEDDAFFDMMMEEEIEKQNYLIQKGWIEVPSDYGRTCWRSPVTCGRTFYFNLDEAYALETDGVGIHAYAIESEMIVTAMFNDVEQAIKKEQAHIAAGEPPHGISPNY